MDTGQAQQNTHPFDAAGVIEAVGSGVQNFRSGDQVFYSGALNRQGSNSEFHLVDERIVGRRPKSLSDAEAAALPLTSITAYQNYELANNFEVDGIGFDIPVYTASASSKWDDNGGETNIEQVTQELRITSDDSERLSYVAGLFYSDLDIERPFSRRHQPRTVLAEHPRRCGIDHPFDGRRTGGKRSEPRSP